MRIINKIAAERQYYENMQVNGIIDYAAKIDECDRLITVSGIPLDELKEMCDAKRDGRCVVLPYPIGNKMRLIDADKLKEELLEVSNREYGNFNAVSEDVIDEQPTINAVVSPKGLDLKKKYNELISICGGDGIENYTNGYKWGHKNGQIELLEQILQISDGTKEAAENALKGGASV